MTSSFCGAPSEIDRLGVRFPVAPEVARRGGRRSPTATSATPDSASIAASQFGGRDRSRPRPRRARTRRGAPRRAGRGRTARTRDRGPSWKNSSTACSESRSRRSAPTASSAGSMSSNAQERDDTVREPGHEPEPGRGDDGERSLAPAEQAREVVTGVVLLEPVEAADHPAVGEHRLDAEQLAAGRSVAQHVHRHPRWSRSSRRRSRCRGRRDRRRTPSPHRARAPAAARASRPPARSPARRARRPGRARRGGAGRGRSRRAAAPIRRPARCCRPAGTTAAPASPHTRTTGGNLVDRGRAHDGRGRAAEAARPVANLAGDDVGIGEHVGCRRRRDAQVAEQTSPSAAIAHGAYGGAKIRACRSAPRLRGRLLVATPPLVDPNFDRTVVLMLEHSDEGALGIVLNRPSDTVAHRRAARVARVRVGAGSGVQRRPGGDRGGHRAGPRRFRRDRGLGARCSTTSARRRGRRSGRARPAARSAARVRRLRGLGAGPARDRARAGGVVRRADPSPTTRSRSQPDGCGTTCCAASAAASRCSPTTPTDPTVN